MKTKTQRTPTKAVKSYGEATGNGTPFPVELTPGYRDQNAPKAQLEEMPMAFSHESMKLYILHLIGMINGARAMMRYVDNDMYWLGKHVKDHDHKSDTYLQHDFFRAGQSFKVVEMTLEDLFEKVEAIGEKAGLKLDLPYDISNLYGQSFTRNGKE